MATSTLTSVFIRRTERPNSPMDPTRWADSLRSPAHRAAHRYSLGRLFPWTHLYAGPNAVKDANACPGSAAASLKKDSELASHESRSST